jgi:hypothetical protein
MPPNSIRERLLLAALAALRPVAAAMGASLHRSPAIALTREQCPALVLFPESDAITERTNGRVTRELSIRVVALAREAPPDAPETQADRLMAAAHAALMADPNLGGLALRIHELDVDFDVEDADAVAVALHGRYRITYRTLQHDITQAG